MSDMQYPEWQKAYTEALWEVDLEKLPARILDAETAILMRVKALQTSSDGHSERVAIADALRGLLVLQTTKLHYPAREKA